MLIKLIAALISTALLSGCSYSYDVLAVAINGHVAFIVDPKSRKQPDCVRSIRVRTDRNALAKSTAGENAQLDSNGIYWRKDNVNDACVNPFPIFYGQPLKGQPFAYKGEQEMQVDAKPLVIGVIYEVNAVSSGSGFGEGRFRVLPNRRIENLPREDALPATRASDTKGS